MHSANIWLILKFVAHHTPENATVCWKFNLHVQLSEQLSCTGVHDC